MKFCMHCGKLISDEAQFCSHCGNPYAPAASQQGQNSYSNPQNSFAPQSNYSQSSNNTPQRRFSGYAPRHSKGSSALALFLSVVMLVEIGVAGWKYPGWFVEKNRGIVSDPDMPSTSEGTQGIATGNSQTILLSQETLDYFGLTQEEYEEILANPIEPTPENSPGNPAFIDITFTQEEYDNAKTYTAEVSREKPEADFPELGIHVDMKWWNLENETDTLIIKKMPEKTCNTTGITLYSYDYSLASGQKEFPTEVEITVPLQGDPRLFNTAIHLFLLRRYVG